MKGTKGKGKKKEKLIQRKRKRERFKSMKIGLCLHWIQIMSDVADVAFFRSSKKKKKSLSFAPSRKLWDWAG